MAIDQLDDRALQPEAAERERADCGMVDREPPALGRETIFGRGRVVDSSAR